MQIETGHLACVRPRVLSPQSGQTLRLHDIIQMMLAQRVTGGVHIQGNRGTGKTIALHDLAARLTPEPRLVLLDEPTSRELEETSRDQLLVYTGDRVPTIPHLATFHMAPWGEDECIEYLLAKHRDKCKSVMARLQAAANRHLPAGRAELWAGALDEMAGDESLTSLADALSRYIDARFRQVEASRHSTKVSKLRRRAGEVALRLLCPDRDPSEKKADPKDVAWIVRTKVRSVEILRLLQFPPLQLMLATEKIARDLSGRTSCNYLRDTLPRDLTTAVGETIRHNQPALQRIKRLFDKFWDHKYTPTTASILLSADPAWRPPESAGICLAGAYLSGAIWRGVELTKSNFSGADLTGIDLWRSKLEGSRFNLVSAAGAKFTGANLSTCVFYEADLTNADFTDARAVDARFFAILENADFTGAVLDGANFQGAKLSNARFVRAHLVNSSLLTAAISDADFSYADLSGAKLRDLPLRIATLDHARFSAADLTNCDLEHMRLPGVRFDHATLHDAILTGSYMPDADFREADLTNAGLAEVEWEHADLRNADLRGATFHMGSSRSGLVFSPLASEGTRTGFYTDEFDEQTYRPPEEIRKANLRGADLSGANIDGVDFYLVDLRDATYDPDQEQHLRRCGAILESRV